MIRVPFRHRVLQRHRILQRHLGASIGSGQTGRTINARPLSTATEPHANRPVLRVLGIETSCDDTAAAVVTSDGRVLGETNRHQYAVHEAHGGIVPGLAADQHLRSIPGVVRSTLDQAGLAIGDIDAIAVTRGPGMPGGLTVGLSAGKTLAAVHGKPLIGVHHMEAHALMARMTDRVAFPFVCLLVSGGHTLSLAVHDVNEYTLIGSTRDDSVGESFDKVARELAVPWIDAQHGGGPGAALEALAREGDPTRFEMPLPMDKSETARSPDFSFSGLKTHVCRMRKGALFDLQSRQDRADVAAAFQATAVRHLVKKTALAIGKARTALGTQPRTLVVSGGVACNQTVRHELGALAAKHGMALKCPPPQLCADNGVMIAWAGIERLRRGLLDAYSIDFIQRWPLDELKRMGYHPRSTSA
ncbi:Mitochondrial tRNAs modification protein [Coemansia erecta]|nr:Mitochondrial tRNAs modification protein [Coemansia erecta]